MIAEAQQDALQNYLRTKQREWAFGPKFDGQRWDVELLAAEFLADARFAQVKLCGSWYGPNETEIRAIVAPLLNLAGYGSDVMVVSAAVALACHRRRVQTNPVVGGVELVAQAVSKLKS